MKKTYARQTQTLVIGGGQAGLTVGYHLAKRGLPFQILDAFPRIGDAWRNRWDSLRLFTPARYAGLPGMPFPLRGDAFPTKQQVADYLESYAQKFRLPVHTGVRVDRLWREGDRFVATSGSERFESEQVVVAMANYQVPRIPSFAHELDPAILQFHSHTYRNPSQLREGGVLVVGAGNSAADIGLEVARTRPTWMSGKESGHIPFPIDGVFGRYFLSRIVRFVGHYVLSLATPTGREARPKLLSRTPPLIRVKPRDLVNAGVKRVEKVTGVQDGRPRLADGRVLDVANVIWCTGYDPGFSWIDLPIFDTDREPIHDRGITRVPGMYFVGLHFLYAMSSATLVGVSRDADYVVKNIAERALARSRASSIRAHDGARSARSTIAIAS